MRSQSDNNVAAMAQHHLEHGTCSVECLFWHCFITCYVDGPSDGHLCHQWRIGLIVQSQGRLGKSRRRRCARNRYCAADRRRRWRGSKSRAGASYKQQESGNIEEGDTSCEPCGSCKPVVPEAELP